MTRPGFATGEVFELFSLDAVDLTGVVFELFSWGGLDLVTRPDLETSFSGGLDLAARAAAFAALVFLAFATACSLRALVSLSLRCESAFKRSSSRAKEL